MKRQIRIGYLGKNNSWEQLLGQIGASWERLNPGQPYPVENYSCVIVDQSLNRTDELNLVNYLKGGGALLDAAGSLYPESVHSASKSTITPDTKDALFGHIDEIPVYGNALTIASSGFLDGTVKIDSSSNRHLAFCGLPVHRLWQEFKPVHKSFGTKETASTFERVSALNSHAYFEVILTILRKLHDKSGLPFVQTWWHPDPEKQVATMRIDSDYGELKTIRRLSESARQLNIPLTCFLHTAHHDENLPEMIQSFPDANELALHCYRHYEYQTSEQYYSDILEGINLLGQNGVEPKGYAAPYGSWSEPLAHALNQSSFQYTSEFGYDYDSLPSTSLVSGIMQLPIHPVSIGSFSRFDADPSDVQSYFKQIIKFKRLTHQPLHLYHHPNDGEPDQFKSLLQLPEYESYHWMTYSEWSDWWKRRSATTFDSMFDTASGQLHLSHPGSGQFPFAIHYKNECHISVIRSSTLHLEELQFRPYINPNLRFIIEKRKAEPNISWFRRKKDQWLTQLWRNRA